jgi:hypothetical protein
LDFFGEYLYGGVRSLAFGVRRSLLSLPPSTRSTDSQHLSYYYTCSVGSLGLL